MTKRSITAQIEEVDYELAQRKSVYERLKINHPSRTSEYDEHFARMEAVKRTLEWVAENETKIKEAMAFMVKKDAFEAMQVDTPPASGRTYHERGGMMVDLAKGGWMHGFTILDGEKAIGTKWVRAETRSATPETYYELGTFSTAREFIAQYEKIAGIGAAT